MFEIQQVPRVKNSRADLLSKLVTSSPSELPRTTFFEVMNWPRIEEPTIVLQIDEEPPWIDPLVGYLKDGTLPMNRKEARKIKYQSANYFLHEKKIVQEILFIASPKVSTTI